MQLVCDPIVYFFLGNDPFSCVSVVMPKPIKLTRHAKIKGKLNWPLSRHFAKKPGEPVTTLSDYCLTDYLDLVH